MCLINVAHEHLITQTGKKSKQPLINFMGQGAEGRGQRADMWGRGGPRAEKSKYPVGNSEIAEVKLKNIYITVKKQPPGVFCRKGALRNFAKFTGKRLCQSLFF